MSQIAIEQANDLVEIACLVYALKVLCENFNKKYDRLIISNDITLSQLEKATYRRLNVNVGIVSFLEIGPEQLIVQFR